MFRYKVFTLIICTCMVFVLSTDNPVTRKVLDLEEVEQQNQNQELNLDKFLAAASSDYIIAAPMVTGFPIAIKDCLPGSVLLLNNIKVVPTELTKGKPISMKAAGVFKAARDVKSLHVEAWYNGGIIFKNDIDKTGHANPGPYNFSYDNNVPTFTPAGHWETYVYLYGGADGTEKLACIVATFDTT